MTKRSRNRRKERRAINAGLGEVKLIREGKLQGLELLEFTGLKKRTKEEILAIRNPAYEYLIP